MTGSEDPQLTPARLRQLRRADWLPSARDDLRGLRGGAWWRAVFLDPTARRWYVGALASVAFTVIFVVPSITQHLSMPTVVWWLVGVGVFILAFAVSSPLAAALPAPLRWLPATGLLLLTCAFIPILGSGFTGLWSYVAVSYAIGLMRERLSIAITLILAVLAFLAAVIAPIPDSPAWTIPLIIVASGVLMTAFTRNIGTVRVLRKTQLELAAVAVEEERNRVARDMHDILGHSLSAIALKADLAAKLADRDPRAAVAEIHEVQTLARSTLSDMRAVVSGYRQVRIASELASLRTLLPAAGIIAHLPMTTDEVPERNRELFGWTLREAATNVIRHAKATECWVTLSAERIIIEDDGIGPVSRDQGATDHAGTGLHGLAERAADAGGSLTMGRSRHGGFLLEVSA